MLRRHWNIYGIFTISALILYILCMSTFNYREDIYGFFNNPLMSDSPQLNERYLKTEYVLSQPEHDILVFGASRLGNIDSRDLEIAVQGPSVYNYSFLSARLDEVLDVIRMLERKGKLPKHAIIGLDIAQFETSWNRRFPNNLTYVMHPLVTSEQPHRLYLSALLKNQIAKMLTGESRERRITYDIENGYFAPTKAAFFIKEAAQEEEMFAGEYLGSYENLKTIHEKLLQNSVQPIYVLLPVPPVQSRRFKDFKTEWKNNLDNIIGQYHDFTDHPVTQLPDKWYDPKHFDADVSTAIIIEVLASENIRSQNTASALTKGRENYPHHTSSEQNCHHAPSEKESKGYHYGRCNDSLLTESLLRNRVNHRTGA